MKGIYIPEYKCAFITANKSGSRGLLNTLVMFFEHINITYQYIDSSDYTVLSDTKYYIMVRNPIERFFTTYSWLMRDESKMTKIEIDRIQTILKKYNIQTIEDYAINYKKLYNELQFDTHFFEQYYSFIPAPNYKNNGIGIGRLQLKKLFDSTFNNYEFVHIETLIAICEKYKSNYNLSDDTRLYVYNKFIIDLFPEFINLPITEKKLSNIFYSYIIDILDLRHHHKLQTYEYRNEYIDRITNNYNQLFKNELILYGYEEPPKIL